MKVLLLTHAFNGLAQRLFCELRQDGHEVSVELDIADSVTLEAVAMWQPDVVVAPFLKRRIPEPLWSTRPCLVVHPGPPGDRGPAALDHALLQGRTRWGVTVLQASGEYDAGPVLAWRGFDVPAESSKSALYRGAVTEGAVAAVKEALAALAGAAAPSAVDASSFGELGWRGALTQADRGIDWSRMGSAEVLRRIRASDGHPGVADALFGQPAHLFDAHAATADDLKRAGADGATPGAVIARRGPALLRATADGAVWIAHVRRAATSPGGPTLKLPATRAFAHECATLPELPVPLMRGPAWGEAGAAFEWDELRYFEHGPADARIGVLSFEVQGGALSPRASARLLAALAEIAARPVRTLVLAGGEGFFCNGIHLHEIEATQLEGGSAADASMAAIEAIDDVTLALLNLTDRWVVAALRGNAGAGGCFLALAADAVWAHGGVVQNPHYRNMGNLHGSEYWTYLLPRRVGEAQAQALMRQRLPVGAAEAAALGLLDEVLTPGAAGFEAAVLARAVALTADAAHAGRIAAKAARRAADEAQRPLAAYRSAELQAMRRNFYGFDPSYHVARHHFVHRKPHAWTPRHLALHRAASVEASVPPGGSAYSARVPT
jgi:putative two-component system hydrogenase maturation factor HypX/HoxX